MIANGTPKDTIAGGSRLYHDQRERLDKVKLTKKKGIVRQWRDPVPSRARQSNQDIQIRLRDSIDRTGQLA